VKRLEEQMKDIYNYKASETDVVLAFLSFVFWVHLLHFHRDPGTLALLSSPLLSLLKESDVNDLTKILAVHTVLGGLWCSLN
jgi:hypothetical protein